MNITNMSLVQTTGGSISLEEMDCILDTISEVFQCRKDEIHNLEPVQRGLTNVVLSFHYKGSKYIYRHPGLGSEELVDRARESILQKQVDELGIDTTLVAMSVKYGWRIGRYVQSDEYDYHNLNHMVRGITLLQKLHRASAKVRYEFDLQEKIEAIKALIPPERYGENFREFENFNTIRDDINQLFELTKTDGIKKTLTHGDCRDENFLINKDEIYLIDWEYAGYGDPGFDIGSYVCGGEHTRAEVDQILYTYFGRKPTLKEKRHFYAYIGISGFFFMHWTMLKESKGQVIGYLKPLWYQNAKTYSKLALELYNTNPKLIE